MDDAILEQGVQASPVVATRLQQDLATFLAPLLAWLDGRLDRRLVQTFVSGIVALLEWRNRAHGLLLSELGAYVLDPAHAPAGTKRLSNLLRSPNWAASDLTDYLWQQADRRLDGLAATEEAALLLWDNQCAGETGKSGLTRPGLGALQQGPAPHPHQARLLPAAGSSPLRARVAVARAAAARAQWGERPADGGAHALVEHAWPACQRSAYRGRRPAAAVCAALGPARLPCVGSRLRRGALAGRRAGVASALRGALAGTV